MFVKGARQTSRHDPQKCIARNPTEYARLVEDYRRDGILNWQQCVVREFVRLRSVPCDGAIKISPSFEFRTFWWRKQLVGAGPYWSQATRYSWTERERQECLAVARPAAERIDCPFLVVDMAQTIEGEWIVIECNDGQESGYAGVSPLGMWHEVIRLARKAAD
ncbi:ATP-grasp domain-containing protein [Lacipirellula sp.]|uniref:ATP-grasp domain-containing protein n=1 Tax=Lacipirellula sp. TaxID=2691419 RepID=UPI003D112EC2